MQTNCEKCVFAKFTSMVNGDYVNKVQIGCDLGRIERFQLNGKVNQEQKDNKFYFVIDRFCNCYREQNSEWANNIPVTERIKTVKEETILNHTVVINFKKGDSLVDLCQFLESCLQSEIRPGEVVILSRERIFNDLLDVALNKLQDADIEWKIVRVIDIVPENLVINELKNSIKTQYFSIFNLPTTLPSNFIKKLHIAINERLERFILLTPINNQGFTVQTWLFKVLEGNLPKIIEDGKPAVSDIQEKIFTFARVNNELHLIKNIEEL